MSLADDLTSRLAAYRDVGEDELPRFWTPEHVQARLVDAFRVLRDMILSFGGPDAEGGGWPDALIEFADQVEGETDPPKERRRQPAADAIAKSEEALRWAARFLADKPLCADALQLWAVCRARITDDEDDDGEQGIRAALARRRKRANVLIEKQWRAAIADRRTGRHRAARDVLQASQGDPYSVLVERLRSTIAERGLEPPAAKPRKQDVYPNKVFSRSRLDAWRKEGAAIVAKRLNAAGDQIR